MEIAEEAELAPDLRTSLTNSEKNARTDKIFSTRVCIQLLDRLDSSPCLAKTFVDSIVHFSKPKKSSQSRH